MFDPDGLKGKKPKEVKPKWKDARGRTVTPDDPLVSKHNLDRDKYGKGVEINENGNANFSPYAKELLPDGSARLTFEENQLKGNKHQKHDEKLARDQLRAAGLSDKQIAALEDGHTWHHVDGGRAMELVPTDLHQAY